jgi:hypothetical protein
VPDAREDDLSRCVACGGARRPARRRLGPGLCKLCYKQAWTRRHRGLEIMVERPVRQVPCAQCDAPANVPTGGMPAAGLVLCTPCFQEAMAHPLTRPHTTRVDDRESDLRRGTHARRQRGLGSE